MRGRIFPLLAQSSRFRAARAASFGAALICAAAGAGCSTLGPIANADGEPTGSISPAAAPPAFPLDGFVAPADQGAVLTAIGAALDPQGPGQPVDWTSGGKRGGEVKPLALARPEGDEICRPFAAEGAGVERRFSAKGVACRNKRGDWRVREMTADAAS